MAFSFMPEAGKPAGDPESLEKRRLMAELMLRRGGDTSPVQHPLQAAARMVGGLTNALAYRNADKRLSEARQSGADASSAAFASLLSGGGEIPSPGSPSSTTGIPGEMGNYADAIASIESAGSGDYSAVGPETQKGNRAYGKYQVMDFNIPSWTRDALGAEMTPGQFLANPEAQDKVFNHRFGSYVEKYGNPQDAASAWFTGRPQAQGSNSQDVLGTTGSSYVNKFNSALGASPAQTQIAGLSGEPSPDQNAISAQTSPLQGSSPMNMGQQPMNRTQAIQALEARGMSRDQADAYAGGFMTSPAARGGMPPQSPQTANNLPMQRDGGPSAGMTGDPRNRPVGVQAGFMDGGLVDQVTPQRQAVAGALRGQSGGMPPEIQAALSNPAVPPETKRMLMAEMLRRNAPPDPMKQLQMQKLQAEVDKMQQPGETKLYELYDEKTGQPYKARLNQQTGKFERVGGVKAPSGTKLVVGPDGEVSFAQGSGVTGGADATKGSTKVDQEYAKDYVAWTTGGASDAQKQLEQLQAARDSLKGKDNISGPLVGNLPDIVSAVVNPEAVSTREAVEEVVQRNLRSVLGSQFTEEEGKRLIARAFNPRLEESENAKRLDRLVAQIEAGYKAKNSAARYFAENQTLTGWKGKLITPQDLEAAIDGKKQTNESSSDALNEARRAIELGADPEKVKERLREMGIEGEL